jgi:hypothetical protein
MPGEDHDSAASLCGMRTMIAQRQQKTDEVDGETLLVILLADAIARSLIIPSEG